MLSICARDSRVETELVKLEFSLLHDHQAGQTQEQP